MSTPTAASGSVELHDGCWIYGYEYTGPIPDYNFYEFSICVQFDFGSERYFSGLRVVVLCRKDVKELEDLKVRETGSKTYWEPRPPEDASWSPPKPSSGADKVPCTVVNEIVDISDDTWDEADIRLRPTQLAGDDAYRIVYEHTQPYAPGTSSHSAMLFLRANHPFRGQLKPSNPLGIERGLPTPMGVVARGARILPPPPLHPPFKQPPPKIMRRIFTEALDSRRSEFWRPSLVAFGRVCKAWVQALEMLYEDFSQYAGGQKAPNMIDVAAALRLNPSRGHAIRRFSPFHFRRRREEQTYAEESLALVDILSTADLVDDLVVKDVFVGHKDRSIQALRGCAAVKMFMVNRGPPKPEEEPETYVLSLADIISCLSRWRQLRVLKVYGFSASVVLDEGGPEPICELKQLHLQGGRANDLDLLRLTSSSFSSLERVDFRDLTGITNAGLTEWLMAMAHTLTWLTFDNCTFPKESWNEHAIDAAISDMEKLRRLDLCGNVCSELVFKRKERKPTPAGICRSSYHISLSNVPVETFTRDFPNVLRETGWDDITMWNALKHDAELRNAAKKVAEEQGIRLRV